MIYCVWYPSGGFGHYIGAVLSSYGDNFTRPNKELAFSRNGNSHNITPAAAKWQNDPDNYDYTFDPEINHCVLVDNGISSQSKKFRSSIPNPTVLKITYNDWSFPIIAHTMVVKAIRSSLEEYCLKNIYWTKQDWGKRQKYFYFLKQHDCHNLWNPDEDCINIDIADIINYNTFKSKLESAGVELEDFSVTHREWYAANEPYIKPALQAQEVIEYIERGENFDLTHITDLWTQAIINYYIWLKYNVEVKHHTLVTFFRNTNEIRQFLISEGVDFDGPNIIKLLTIADGFGDSGATPPWYRNFTKWPELIQRMTKNVKLTNLSRYGAGNEYMVECLRANIDSADIVLFQWTHPYRLDLLLGHGDEAQAFWEGEIKKDAVYNNNVLSINNDRYWISSASKNQYIQDYHNRYISRLQHQRRTELQIEYAAMLLEKKNKAFKFLLTYPLPFLRSMDIDKDNWIWHEEYKSMEDFRSVSKYAHLDLKSYVQPIPLIQFDFIRQHIMPRLDLEWNSAKELDDLETFLYNSHTEAMKNQPI